MTFLNPSKMMWEEQSLSKFANSPKKEFSQYYKKRLLFYSLLVIFIFANITMNLARAETARRQKVKILPLISFYSSLNEGEVYNWWAENDSLGEMKIFSDHINRSLEQSSLSKWEYIAFKELHKESDSLFQNGSLSLEQKQEFAKLKGAGLILAGDVRVQPSPLYEKGVRINQKLELLRVKNGEAIGESLKITDLPRHEYAKLILMGHSANKDFFANLIADLHEKIESYKIAEKLVSHTQLVLMGSLSDQQIEKIKDKIQKHTSGLQNFKTLSFERDQIVLLAEGVTSEKLSQALGHILWKDYRTQVVSTDTKQVVFDVRAKSKVN